MSRVCTLIVFTLAVAGVLAFSSDEAKADSLRISCDVYATNQVDPIAETLHNHRQFGNTSPTNASEWSTLRANKDTSCTNAPYLTSAGWYPVERYEESETAILYYRAPGDDEAVHALPEGIELIARKAGLTYNCGAEPLNTTDSQTTPPYGCTQNWATHVRFPACWNGKGLKSENTVYGPTRVSCPSTHPHRLIEVNITITHKNLNGKVPNPLRVSVGTNAWGEWKSMHADYFFAAQDAFYKNNRDLDRDGRVEQYDANNNGRYEPWLASGDSEKNLTDLCILDAPDSLAYANARCRADGLLNAHVNQLKNYYVGKPIPSSSPATFSNPPSAPYPYPTPT